MSEIAGEDILFPQEPLVYGTPDGNPEYSVTTVIRWSGLGENFSNVPAHVMEVAQRRGKMVHLACQYFDAGELDLETVDVRILPYVTAYIKFRAECQVKPIAVEQRISHKLMGLSGTPDLIAFVNGRRAVIDRKTGNPDSRPARLQTGGYKVLWEAYRPLEPIYDRYGLKLGADGNYRLVAHCDPDDIAAFIDLNGYVRAEQKMSRWLQKYGVTMPQKEAVR